MADDPGREAPGFWAAACVLVGLAGMSSILRAVGFKRLYVALHRRAKKIALRKEARASTADLDHGDAGLRSETPDEARRVAALVMLVNRHYSPLEAGCLVEALTIWWTLRRRAITAELCLGVRTLVGPLQSHAWVEYEGVPLNDSESVGQVFEPFDLSEISSDAEFR